MRLIDADAFIKPIEESYRSAGINNGCFKKIKRWIRIAPTIDAVSVGTLEQIKWERDVALKQLEEIDKGLGSKMDDVGVVVKCKDCEYWQADNFEVKGYGWRCGNLHIVTKPTFFLRLRSKEV